MNFGIRKVNLDLGIHTSGNGKPSNFHIICGVGLPVALPGNLIFPMIFSFIQ